MYRYIYIHMSCMYLWFNTHTHYDQPKPSIFGSWDDAKRSFRHSSGDTSWRPCGSCAVLTQWAAMEDFITETPEGWMQGDMVIFLQPRFLWFFISGMYFFQRKKTWCFYMRGLSSCLLSYWYTEYVLNRHIAIYHLLCVFCGATSPVSKSILFSELMKWTKSRGSHGWFRTG